MKRLFFLIFFNLSLMFGAAGGVTGALSFLNGLNFFPKSSKHFRNYNYYKNFYAEAKLELENRSEIFDIYGIALAFPASEMFTVEAELFTSQSQELSSEDDEIRIRYGYGISFIGYYPFSSSLILTGRYGWNSIKLQEETESEVEDTDLKGGSYGFGVTLHLLPKIYISYEYRKFPSHADGFSDDSSVYSIEIKF